MAAWLSGGTLAARAETPEPAGTANAEQAGAPASEPGAIAVIARPADPEKLELPALPEVEVAVEGEAGNAGATTDTASAPAPSEAEIPAVTLALPEPPAIELAEDLGAGTTTASIGSKVESLEIPEVPPVSVTIVVPPAAAPAMSPALPEAKPALAALTLEEPALRAAFEGARARFKLTPAEIESFMAFYAARGFRPVWLAEAGERMRVSPAAEAVAGLLASADMDGLDATRLIGALPATRKGEVAADASLATEAGFALAAFLYAHDARGGRLEPSRLSALLTPKLDIPAPQAVLEPLATAAPQAVAGLLAAHQPPHAGYRALKVELARVRREIEQPVLTGSVAGAPGAPQPSGTLPANWMEGAPLLPGKADPRVPMLRVRLGLPASAANLYDDELREAVIRFQKANELTANGRITPRTRAALEDPKAPKDASDAKPDLHRYAAQIVANMERWRWLPRDLGRTHIFVNVPDYRMRFIENGAQVFETRVIVGKPETQTPIFSDAMDHLIVNPSWHVPPSILKKEFLPKLATDPDYAARRGFEVVRRGNSISVRQPPGERNALGHIKFMFPNQHSVYLHDTPSRNLFSADQRAFSHGCVRVQNPFSFAEKLIGNQGFDERSLRGMVGRGERMIRLQEKIPVHLTYFTLFADESGVIQHRRDLYGHDARIRTALAL